MIISVPLFFVLVLVIPVIVYFCIRPLQVLTQKQWLVSHAFIVIGLLLLTGYLLFNQNMSREITMLAGGIWTVAGGLCFVATFLSRRFKNKV